MAEENSMYIDLVNYSYNRHGIAKPLKIQYGNFKTMLQSINNLRIFFTQITL